MSIGVLLVKDSLCFKISLATLLHIQTKYVHIHISLSLFGAHSCVRRETFLCHLQPLQHHARWRLLPRGHRHLHCSTAVCLWNYEWCSTKSCASGGRENSVPKNEAQAEKPLASRWGRDLIWWASHQSTDEQAHWPSGEGGNSKDGQCSVTSTDKKAYWPACKGGANNHGPISGSSRYTCPFIYYYHFVTHGPAREWWDMHCSATQSFILIIAHRLAWAGWLLARKWHIGWPVLSRKMLLLYVAKNGTNPWLQIGPWVQPPWRYVCKFQNSNTIATVLHLLIENMEFHSNHMIFGYV